MIIVSIPHTGTRFLRSHFSKVTHIHTHVGWGDLMRRLKKEPVIIAPIRDPKAVWVSWSRRGKTELEFMRSFYTMHALSLIREIDFIAVDLKQDLRITDWTPIGEDDPGKTFPVQNFDCRPLYQLPFVKQFYEP